MITTHCLGSGSEAKVYEILGNPSVVLKRFRRPRTYGWTTGGPKREWSSWIAVSDSVKSLHDERRALDERNKRLGIRVPLGDIVRFEYARDETTLYVDPLMICSVAETTLLVPRTTRLARAVRVVSRHGLSEVVYEKLRTSFLDYLDVSPLEKCIAVFEQIFLAGIFWWITSGFSHNDLSVDNVMMDGDRAVILDFCFATFGRPGSRVIRADFDFVRPEEDFGPILGHPVRDFLELCWTVRESTTNHDLKNWLAFVPDHGFTENGFMSTQLLESLGVC